jgi:glycogen(starch) synthase
MRVLMTTDTIGGVWTFTKELSSELLAHGCDVALVSLGRLPSDAQQAWAEAQETAWGSRFRFDASDAPLEWMQDNERAFRDAEPLLQRVVEEFGPDLLLSSQFCFGALDCYVPRIVVAHSDVLSWGDACRPEGLSDSVWLETYRRLVSRGLQQADAVVAPTAWMMKSLREHFAVPETCVVIANGRSIRPADRVQSRKPQAITAGRLWDEAKNLRMLEDVDSPMPVLIAGEAEYESNRMRLGESNTRLLGAMGEDELLQLFRESAIYICTSQYEPFGLAPLEAALCGCAVLANDIPSLREVWGKAAAYFCGAESLTAWLACLGREEWLLRDLQRRSMHRAMQLTSARMAEGYLELFQSMRKEAAVGRYVA